MIWGTQQPPPPLFQKEHIKLRENLKFCPVLSKIQLFKNVKFINRYVDCQIGPINTKLEICSLSEYVGLTLFIP